MSASSLVGKNVLKMKNDFPQDFFYNWELTAQFVLYKPKSAHTKVPQSKFVVKNIFSYLKRIMWALVMSYWLLYGISTLFFQQLMSI